jgi:TP901 family phage tail tape measure protein
MADVNANIGVNIDTSDALNQLKNLQRQISQFHQSVAKSSSAAAVAQRDLQKNFVSSVNAIQGFSAELRTVRTSAESFTNSLEKNKFSIREYFRYAAGATKTFGKKFGAEFSTIEKTAIERVKTLQTQYIKMGRDAQGAMQAIAIRPTVLNMKDLGTQTAIAAQKQVLFNQLVKQGSTNLLNFGKNTQWAGRQLMVGFTLPLATLGMTAGRVFMDMEKAAIKFKKVYGDLFTAPEETQKAMDSITELGLSYTKYGVAVADSLSVAADAAAAGFQGVDLQNQTTASLKLSVLGQMELQKALETTIALQNAFRISSEELVGTIDFLNAVENQTVVSLEDITEATPRVATVIQALGGNVKDLAFFLAAMKEGGVNAAQGANALKSGLASLINPTERASELLLGMGVNIRAIVSDNQGDLRGTVLGFARALDSLDPMRRAQAIEQLFGKFQFARISALFDNVIREGSQASRVLDLAGSSLSDLAALSEKELGTQAASSMNKFTSAIERIKVALVPLGEMFLEIATPFVDFGTKLLEAFNNLPDGVRKAIGTVITVVGGIGPVLLMTFGLINNGIANMIKFFATVRLGYLKMTGQAKGIGDETQYMTQEQLEAAAAAASLDQAHSNLTQRFTAEKTAVDALRDAYTQAAAAGARFAMNYPGMMKPGFGTPTKMAKGGVVTVGGRGNKDTEPALLTPGEAVIPAEMVKKYQPLIQGMIAGNIPGYANGVMLGMPKSAKSVSKNREAAQQVYEMFLKSSYANTAPTEYGHQISPTSGHSFPIFGLGGVYQKGNKQVFVKPVLDEKAALAEMRSTEISRRAHGLEAPEQRIVVIRDPMDTTRQRRFLALESDLDPKFVNNQPMGVFNEEQYFRQLVASLLRVDKDLSGSNVYGNVVADAGPGGVFNRASGLRDYEKNLPSMEEQALINLLGIRGGAKRAFAESTLGLMAGLTPEQYHQRMLAEIQKVLPRLKETIASFKLTNPTEVGVYDDMIRRLEQGLGVDWSKFHAVHSAVKIPKPKAKTQAAPQGFANGGMVRGPGGPKDDAIPANLSNGEAVIDAETVKKNPGIIAALFQKKKIIIPGYAKNNAEMLPLKQKYLSPFFGKAGSTSLEASHFGSQTPTDILATLAEDLNVLGDEADDFRVTVREYSASADENKKKVYEAKDEIMRLTEVVERFNKSGTVAAVGGATFGGSAVLEPKIRNKDAYEQMQKVMTPVEKQRMGTLGASESLQDVEAKGRIAARALENVAGLSDDVVRVLTNIRTEGANATEALASTTASEQNLEFMISQREKSIKTNLKFADPNLKGAKLQERLAQVDSELINIKNLYEQEVSEGMAEQQALRKAQARLRLLALKQSELEGNTRTSLHVGTNIPGTVVKQGAAGRISGTSVSGKKETISNWGELDKLKSGTATPEMLANSAISGMLKGAESGEVLASEAELLARQVVFEMLDSYSTGIEDATLDFRNIAGQELLNSAEASSPSQKTIQATDAMVDGVTQTLVESKAEVKNAADQMLQPATQAIKNTSSESSFGNINTKEPVPAVGNAPRQVVAAMTQETTASRTFAGDLKASFANARANITREMGFVKEELGAAIQQIKQKFSKGGVELAAVAQKTNQGLIVNGKDYGFNAIAQAQGRDGAIEAIVTRKNAEIIAKATEAYNAGTIQIPRVIKDGIKSQESVLNFGGENIAQVIVASMRKKTAELAATIPSYATPAPGMRSTPEGPGENPAVVAARISASAEDSMKKVQSFSNNLSAFSFGLSSLTGILSAFGMDLNGILPIISGVTAAMFALTMVTSQLSQTQAAKNFLEAKSAAGGFAPLVSGLSRGAKGLTGFGNVVKGIFGAIKGAFPIASRLVPVLGGLLLAFEAFKFLNKLYEDGQRRLRGLSDAANMSSEKIKKLGEAAGAAAVLSKASFAQDVGEGAVVGESQVTANTFVENLGGQDKFREQYADELAAIEDAKGDTTRLLALYQSLAIQFNNLGIDGTQIQTIINALKLEANETDVKLDFKSLTVFDENGKFDISAIETRATTSADAYKNAYDTAMENFTPADPSEFQEQQVGNLGVVRSVEELGNMLTQQEALYQSTRNNMITGGLTALEADQDATLKSMKFELDGIRNLYNSYSTDFDPSANAGLQAVVKETVAATTSELESLRAAFDAGKLGLEEYNSATAASVSPLLNMGDASENLSSLLTELEVPQETIDSLQGVNDKSIVLNAVLAKVPLKEFNAGLKSKDPKERAQALSGLAAATAKVSQAQDALNEKTGFENAVRPLQDSIKAVRGQIKAYNDVNKATGDSALAWQIAGDAALTAAFKQAQAADAAAIIAGEIPKFVNLFIEDMNKVNKLNAQLKGFDPSGGSAAKSSYEESMSRLKEQRKEIRNGIKAYAGLRKANVDVARAAEIAGDSLFAAALASKKVGSKEWKKLYNEIERVRKAEEKWKNTTLEGKTAQFNEVYSKVSEIFSAQEAILEANNESATKTNRELIESLEAEIEGYERQIGTFQRDLDKIAEKEDEINKTYDKKVDALEAVKKLNQDILNQQKSQLSIADALSQGDIAGAASAMQESRAQNAAAQGDATRNALDIARQSELKGLKENGLTREQIEGKIKTLKGQISTIEFGSLQTARDAVEAADKALEKARGSLTVNGLTKAAWDAQKASIDVASSRAALYKSEADKALGSVKGITSEWNSLNGRVITTYYQSLPMSEKGKAPKGKADGGYISGPGTATSDSIPALLSNGEYVIKAASVTKFGKNFLDAINAGNLPGFKKGGSALKSIGSKAINALSNPAQFNKPVYNMPERDYADLGSSGISFSTSGGPESSTAVDNSVYNYNLSVNVGGTNATPEQIANVVMRKIQSVGSQRLRGQVVR